MAREITNLEQMLDRIDRAADVGEQVSLGAIVKAIGSRSFGPLLLMVGIILFSPLSGIPGMATIMAALILLIAIQMILRREYFWLPRWLLARSIARTKFCKALEWLQRPARFIDRLVHPRLAFFIQGFSKYIVAIFCIVIAAGMPMMEFVPFSASTAGVALAAFGLALIAHDGLLALLAFVATAITSGLVVYNLL
jgi:hypothetical protein